MGTFLTILVLVVLAGFVGVVWIVGRILRFIFRAVFGLAPRPQPSQAYPSAIVCSDSRCRASNRGHARFCRRCGRVVAGPLATGPATPLRYVA